MGLGATLLFARNSDGRFSAGGTALPPAEPASPAWGALQGAVSVGWLLHAQSSLRGAFLDMLARAATGVEGEA